MRPEDTFDFEPAREAGYWSTGSPRDRASSGIL